MILDWLDRILARLGLLTVRLGPPAKPRTPKPKETTNG